MMDDASMKAPPPRLLEDPAISTELHEGLSELASQQAPFDAAAGLSSLQSALQSSAELGAASASATLSSGVLIGGSVALILVGAGMYAWFSPSSLSPSSKAPARERAAPSGAPVEQAPPVAPAEPVLEVPSTPVIAAPEPKAVEAVRSAAPDAPLDREVALMVKAKALVQSKPDAALAILQRLEREHRRGALSEERAGLRVLALWSAGELERARTERAAFLARYPQSPLRERLTHLGEAP